eukprot:7566599-Alexandrium_andersonii.AAC.1
MPPPGPVHPILRRVRGFGCARWTAGAGGLAWKADTAKQVRPVPLDSGTPQQPAGAVAPVGQGGD